MTHKDFPMPDDELFNREPNDEDNPYFIMEHILACREHEHGDDCWEEWHDDYINKMLRAFLTEDDENYVYDKLDIYRTKKGGKIGDFHRWVEYRRNYQKKINMFLDSVHLEDKGVKFYAKGGIMEQLAKNYPYAASSIRDLLKTELGKAPTKRTPIEGRINPILKKRETAKK
jgi:hypothetical protein